MTLFLPFPLGPAGRRGDPKELESRFEAFVQRARDHRPAPESDDEARLQQEFAHLGLTALQDYSASMVESLEGEFVGEAFRSPESDDADRRDLLRVLQKSLLLFARLLGDLLPHILSERSATVLGDLDAAEMLRADADSRRFVRWQTSVMIARACAEAPLDELRYWVYQAERDRPWIGGLLEAGAFSSALEQLGEAQPVYTVRLLLPADTEADVAIRALTGIRNALADALGYPVLPPGAQRDVLGRWFVEVLTSSPGVLRDAVAVHGARPTVDVELFRGTASEECANCGNRPGDPLPAVCTVCGFRDVSACPHCARDLPRLSYQPLAGNIVRCGACGREARMALNPVLFDDGGRLNEPAVVLSQVDTDDVR